MARLLRFLFQLVLIALCFGLVSVGWLIFDGLNDVGDRADVALVVKTEGDVSADAPALERAARLLRDGVFNQIIVYAPQGSSPAPMAKFLEDHGVPADDILSAAAERGQDDAVSGAAGMIKARGFHSVMVVADYYRITRIKVSLLHAGVTDLKSAHSRSASLSDALPIAYEVGAVYDFFFRTFVLPVTRKIESEASTEAGKARAETDQAGQDIQKHIDNLPK